MGEAVDPSTGWLIRNRPSRKGVDFLIRSGQWVSRTCRHLHFTADNSHFTFDTWSRLYWSSVTCG
jgi:hypothetical protein